MGVKDGWMEGRKEGGKSNFSHRKVKIENRNRGGKRLIAMKCRIVSVGGPGINLGTNE